MPLEGARAGPAIGPILTPPGGSVQRSPQRGHDGVWHARHTRTEGARIGGRDSGGTPLGHAVPAKEVHMSTAARIAIGLVLLAFADLNFYVVSQYGYAGFLELATANAATTAVLVDLTIALSFVAVWMWRDARRRGITVVPIWPSRRSWEASARSSTS
jgi:hypothetical protein